MSTGSSTSSGANTNTIPALPGITPSRSTRMLARPRVTAVRFGGGHALYIRDGNAPPDHEWNVVWQALDGDSAERLTDFLEARGGMEAFLWQPPEATETQRFLCPEWQVTPDAGDVVRITARFIRLYP